MEDKLFLSPIKNEMPSKKASNDHIVAQIQYLTLQLDTYISQQLNFIIHHPRFQKLEASWQGLHYLIHQVSDSKKSVVKIKILNIGWPELSKDLLHAADFDQSCLFAKIYHHEFGQAGGEPFGLLVGDYYISHQNTGFCHDLEVLLLLGKIAAAAFAPFLTAVSSKFLGLNDFSEFQKTLNFEAIFQQAEYQFWNKLRRDEDARFLGLLLPHVLMRLPYRLHYPFCFIEELSKSEYYLWGNPIYCFAAVALRCFEETGWFAAMRGRMENISAGQVKNLPVLYFQPDASFLAKKAPVAVVISEQQERNLLDCGFTMFSVNEKTNDVMLYECRSLQQFKKQGEVGFLKNSQLAGMIHYLLCVSRFAHYLKFIAREMVGKFSTPEECENQLQNWIRQYTAASTDLSEELQAKYPLREAKITVQEHLGNISNYLCTIHLVPHYQFSQFQTFIQLQTEIGRTL